MLYAGTLAAVLAATVIAPQVRYDPYKSYRFELSVDGTPVAGFSTFPNGSVVTLKPPGRTKYEPITLERGVTHDAAFAQWAATSGASAPGSRPRSCALTERDPGGRVLRVFTTASCRISEYAASPVAIAHIKLQALGWTRLR